MAVQAQINETELHARTRGPLREVGANVGWWLDRDTHCESRRQPVTQEAADFPWDMVVAAEAPNLGPMRQPLHIEAWIGQLGADVHGYHETIGERIQSADSREAIVSEIWSKTQNINLDLVMYQKRIQSLTEQAELEGYSLNRESKTAFFAFLNDNQNMKRGGLVLMENGNLRGIWRDENGTHVGLQFLNPESVQYVIFRRREHSSSVSRVSGRDTLDGIKRQFEAFELSGMLCV